MKGYEALKDMAENPGKVYQLGPQEEQYRFRPDANPAHCGDLEMRWWYGGKKYSQSNWSRVPCITVRMVESDLWEPVQ